MKGYEMGNRGATKTKVQPFIEFAGVKARVLKIETPAKLIIVLYSTWDEVRQLFWKHLKRGDSAKFPAQGVTVWLEYHAELDGEHREVWDETGEKIRVTEVFKVRDDIGDRELKIIPLKKRWMSYKQYEKM